MSVGGWLFVVIGEGCSESACAPECTASALKCDPKVRPMRLVM